MSHRKIFSRGTLLALAACCLLAAPAAAQPPGNPMTGSEAQSAGYPNASRWPGGEIERVEGGRKLPETAGDSSAALAGDTDGNLANGTPHCRELAAAADSRNLPHPACPPDRLGYVFANNQTAASYIPPTAYSYNSAEAVAQGIDAIEQRLR